MRRTLCQPARFFAAGKRHKFIDLKQMDVNNLKIWSKNRRNWYPLIRLFKNNCQIFTTISDKQIYGF